jgi:hypothetical protein
MKYCIDCKFYEYLSWLVYPRKRKSFPNHICLAVSKVHYNAIKTAVFDNLVDCLIQNREKNCKYYKRLWYKFWIKGDK